MRRVLGIRRRVPDTTVRNLLCRLEPMRLRAALHRLIRAAPRRKALEREQLPFGVAALDGKGTAIDNHYAQRHAEDEHRGVVRTITASLVSARGRPCIDAFPVHASTNEMGQFESGLGSLMDAYQGLGLFRVVRDDAGACSLYNADRVCNYGLDYLFGLKNSQPTLRLEAERLLGHLTEAAAKTEDVVGPTTVVRRVFVSNEIAGFLDWAHLKTVVRIEAETLARDGTHVAYENRYYISSLPMAELGAVRASAGFRRFPPPVPLHPRLIPTNRPNPTCSRELREHARAAGADVAGDVRCYGRNAHHSLRVWCEARLYLSAQRTASCERGAIVTSRGSVTAGG